MKDFSIQECEIEFVHPELQKGEVFFTNAKRSVFMDMSYSTKRLGNTAYNGKGEHLSTDDWYPVFLQETELVSIGKTLKEIRVQNRKIEELKAS